MSRALRVARQDFEYAIRSYLLLAIVAIFGLLVVLVAGLPGMISRGRLTGSAVVWFVTVLSGLLVPLIAVVASYLAVVGERETGTLKLLLSLPPTRRDVVLGKVLGRTAVVWTTVVVATVIAILVSFLVYGTAPLGAYGVATALTLLLAVAFVGLTVGISAATRTRQRAVAAAVSVYVLFVAFWSLLIQALRFFLEWGLSIRLGEQTVTLLTILSPGEAYGRLVNSLVVPSLLGGGAADAIAASAVDPTGGPVYLQPVFLIVLLLAWTVVPIILGYWRFEGADLG